MRERPEVTPLFFIADAPTFGEPRILEVLRAILPQFSGSCVTVVDRDRAPDRGGSTNRERLNRLRRMRAITEEHGAHLVVKGRPDLALLSGAQGVQLPEQGLDVATVKNSFPSLRVGRSCHDIEGLVAAEHHGADWAFLSPVWAPLSKASTAAPYGFRRFIKDTQDRALPVLALGGIDPERAETLIAHGASGVAMMGAVFACPHPKDFAIQMQAILNRFDKCPH